MKRLFYIHDIQDLWLFGELLESGSTIFYNNSRRGAGGKCTAPWRFVDQLKDFNLIPYKEDFIEMQRAIDECDQFITKECHPYPCAGFSNGKRSLQDTKQRNKEKLISLAWIGESSNPSVRYHHAVKDSYKMLFTTTQYAPIYKALGFNNISSQEPKFTQLNNLDRQKACEILKLDSSKRYATFLISAGGSLDSSGALNNLYSDQNKVFIDRIKAYCKDNNIEIISKNKRKHFGATKGLPGKTRFHGTNLFYHETLLLSNISEFTVGFGSSAVLEAEEMGCNYVNFLAQKHIGQDAEKIWLSCRDGNQKSCKIIHPSGLSQKKSSFDIEPNSTIKQTSVDLENFLNNSSAANFSKKYSLHKIFA
jgi:hypothetical protein